MIDIHILLLGNEDKVKLDECLKSLENEPITLHICDGIKGDLQTARRLAISKGTNDYIGWVDPDDTIIPGAYNKLLSHIPEYGFVWAKEEVRTYTENCKTLLHTYTRTRPHHMHIIHRNLIKSDYFEERRADEWVCKLIKDGKFVDEIGYIWNRYPNSNGKIFYESVINAIQPPNIS